LAPGSPLAGTNASTRSPGDRVPNDMPVLTSNTLRDIFVHYADTDAVDLDRHSDMSAGAAISSRRATPGTLNTIELFSALRDQIDMSIPSENVEEHGSASINHTAMIRGSSGGGGPAAGARTFSG